MPRSATNMGIWSRFNPDILENAEDSLIRLSDLSYPASKRRVPLADGLFIHCVTCGDPSRPILVLIHGYLGGGMLFFKMLKLLETEFHIYLVDLLGMGRSSRPVYTPQNVDEAEAFFVESLEQFFVTEELQSFVLAGHSLGGYISGCYAVKYPHRVSQLLLISPVGAKLKPEGYSWKSTVKDFKSRIARITLRFEGWMFRKNITGPDVLRKLGPFSGAIIRKWTRKKFSDLSSTELRALDDYLEQINLMPGSSEYSINQILELGAWARKPLAEQLAVVEMPIVCYYGDKDWMSPGGAVEVAERTNAKVYIEIVPGAGHHIYLDSPEILANSIIEQVHNPGRTSDYDSFRNYQSVGR